VEEYKVISGTTLLIKLCKDNKPVCMDLIISPIAGGCNLQVAGCRLVADCRSIIDNNNEYK